MNDFEGDMRSHRSFRMKFLKRASWSMNVTCLSLIPIFLTQFAAAQSAPQPIGAWDATTSSDAPLTADAVKNQEGWIKKARGDDPSFSGDAVLGNGRLTAVFRRRAGGVELYSGGYDSPAQRVALRVRTEGNAIAVRLVEATLASVTRSTVAVSAVYATADDELMTATFTLNRGGVALEVAPGPGAGGLRIEAPGRFVVLPDFFADDILVDARKTRVATAELPSENFLMHMLGDGDAIAMCVFENGDQDVQIAFTGEGDERVVSGSEIRFGGDQRIWISLLDSGRAWHAFETSVEDAGRVRSLDWKPPYPAQWRFDFTRTNGLTDSWEMLIPDPASDGYIKPSWLPTGPDGGEPSRTGSGEVDLNAYQPGGPASSRLPADRKRWTTVLGRFEYPCWEDEDGMVYVQPLDHAKMTFEGAAVVYPIHRLPETPIDEYAIVDVMRTTLGVGPCEYILGIEGQRQEHVGRATCHVRAILNEIYQSNRQLESRDEIETYLQDGLDFVTHIRNRIESYLEFGREMREYLAEQKTLHPELAETLDEMDAIVAELDERFESRRESVKSPAYVAELNADFREEMLTYVEADVMLKLKEYTDALTKVGGNQDELVGECRWIVRTLRQRAALAMTEDPRLAEIAEEIRARTQEALLKPSAYEAARH